MWYILIANRKLHFAFIKCVVKFFNQFGDSYSYSWESDGGIVDKSTRRVGSRLLVRSGHCRTFMVPSVFYFSGQFGINRPHRWWAWGFFGVGKAIRTTRYTDIVYRRGVVVTERDRVAHVGQLAYCAAYWWRPWRRSPIPFTCHLCLNCVLLHCSISNCTRQLWREGLPRRTCQSTRPHS